MFRPVSAWTGRARRPRRVANIVKAIEERDQIVTTVNGITLRACDLKCDLVQQAVARCRVARIFDGATVIVEGVKPRFWKCPGHQERGGAWPQPTSATVALAAKSLANAVQRRNPGTQQIVFVVRPKEPFGTEEQVGILLVPTNTSPVRNACVILGS